MNKKFTVAIDVPMDVVSDVVGTALDSYMTANWCQVVKGQAPKKWTFTTPVGDNDDGQYLCNYPFNEGGSITFTDIEEDDGKELVLDMEAIERGLKLFSEDKEMSHHFSDFISENGDMITADVFLQYCLLGKVIYG